MTFEIYNGDARKELSRIPDESVDCCITSPPYFGLRDYGTGKWVGGDPDCSHRNFKYVNNTCTSGKKQNGLPGNVGNGIYKTICPKCGAVRVDSQIGLEKTPSAYISSLMEVFNEVYRVLKPTGTLWLNLGDSYSGSGRGQYPDRCKDPKRAKTQSMKLPKDNGLLPAKNMYGIPWRMAFALQSAGWILRQDIIWHKPQTMPEPVKDRCVKSHEYIFLLSKEPSYYFDYKAIQEPSYYFDSDSRAGKRNPRPEGKRKNAKGMDNTPVIINEMKNKRDVWSVNTDHFEGAHFATFPPKLIQPMVLAGCPRGGVILDPFTGSGTTGVVALLNGRNFVGCELSPEYHSMATKRIEEAWEASPSLF